MKLLTDKNQNQEPQPYQHIRTKHFHLHPINGVTCSATAVIEGIGELEINEIRVPDDLVRQVEDLVREAVTQKLMRLA